MLIKYRTTTHRSECVRVCLRETNTCLFTMLVDVTSGVKTLNVGTGDASLHTTVISGAMSTSSVVGPCSFGRNTPLQILGHYKNKTCHAITYSRFPPAYLFFVIINLSSIYKKIYRACLKSTKIHIWLLQTSSYFRFSLSLSFFLKYLTF